MQNYAEVLHNIQHTQTRPVIWSSILGLKDKMPRGQASKSSMLNSEFYLDSRIKMSMLKASHIDAQRIFWGINVKFTYL